MIWWVEVMGAGLLAWWAGMLPAMYISARFWKPRDANGSEWWFAFFWPLGIIAIVFVIPGYWLWNKGIEQGQFAEARKKREIDR